MEWISVKDRLPTAAGWYLAAAGGEVWTYHYDDDIEGGWSARDPDSGRLCQPSDPITDWMPLPPAPRSRE
jgi:hypothetical protein